MLGEVEGVEPQLFHGSGQDGGREVAVGQGGGDAEAHGQDPVAGLAANSASVPLPTAVPRSEPNAPCSRRLASSTASRRAARTERAGGSGGAARVGRDPRGQGNRLVEDGPGVAHPEGDAEVDGLGCADPVRREQHPRRLLPSHQRGEEDAAGRLRRDAQFGEGDSETRVGVDQDEVAMREDREAETDSHAVDGGKEGYGELDQALQQSDEALSRAFDRGPGGNGRHLGQVLSRGERGAPPGQHDGADGLVAVCGAQRGRALVVHGGVEGVAHFGPVEGEDSDAGRRLVDLYPVLRHGSPQSSSFPGPSWCSRAARPYRRRGDRSDPGPAPGPNRRTDPRARRACGR